MPVDGGHLWADDTGGDGPVLVLLHPGWGDSSIWLPVLESLPRTTALSGMTPAVSGIRLPQRHRSARWTTWPQYWITAILIWRSWLGTAAVAARRSGLRSPTRPASADCCC